MSRHLRTLAAVLLAAPLLAGCGAGVYAQTSVQGSSGNGATAKIGALSINGMNIVVPAGVNVSQKQPDASLMLRVFNAGAADQLIDVSVPADAAAGVVTQSPAQLVAGISGSNAPAFNPIDLPATSSTGIGQEGLIPAIRVLGLKTSSSAWVPVTLQFKNAGTSIVPVLVVPAAGYNSGVPVPRRAL